MTPVVAPCIENIPGALRALPQWVCWRLDDVRGRKTKVPYAAKTGQKASSTDPATWAMFEETLAAFQCGGYAGIGFVFANTGIVGVDLDHCLKNGVLHPDAEKIVKTLNSYTEISPSGDGLHVLLLGKKSTTSCAKPVNSWGGECAIYEKARFFVMTGQLFPGFPTNLQPRQGELDWLCAHLWPGVGSVQKIAELKAGGMSVRQIADHIGVGKSSVSRALQSAAEERAPDGYSGAYSGTAENPGGTPGNRGGTPEDSSEKSGGTPENSGGTSGGTAEHPSVPPEKNGVPQAVPPENLPVPLGVPPGNSGVPPENLAVPLGVPQSVPPVAIPDADILQLIKRSKAGAKFDELWAGNWNGPLARCMSHSEADLKLCCHLAFYTKDAARLDRLFRQSGLIREKWDEARPEDGTYGARTIRRALERVTKQYSGKGLERIKARAAASILEPETDDAKALLERGRKLVDELRAAPDVTKLASAISDFLWRLPDIYLDEVKAGLASALPDTFKPSSFDRAVRQERIARKKQAASTPPPRETGATEKPALRNHEVLTVVDEKGEPKDVIRVIPIERIRTTLLKHTSDWPRRVEALLFADENGTIRYLEQRDDLLAWAQERMPVFWANGQDAIGQSLLTKGEFLAHLQAVVTRYEAVEELPHEPVMPGHYYAWRPPADYQPTGEYLRRLLDFFDNPETIDDLLLIKAALMTPAWGGLPGKRPAFVIMAPDRGCGKSTLANVIGHLYGGHIELNLTDTAEDKLTSRLLTPGAMTKRVVRIDNIKEYYNSAFIEGLITAPTVSGHRLYYGDASRPNTLTFVLTGNALRLSRDIAERAFIIRLAKPTYRADWEAEVCNFVAQNRVRILMDIIAELRKPPGPITTSDRYADWVKGVLSRCGGDTDAVVRMNNERRGACDEDQDEAGTIMAAIDKFVAEQHSGFLAAVRARGEDTSDVRMDEWTFISSTEMTDVVRKALNEPLTSKAVKSRLEGHIEAGRLPRVRVKRTSTSKGYVIQRQTTSDAKGE